MISPWSMSGGASSSSNRSTLAAEPQPRCARRNGGQKHRRRRVPGVRREMVLARPHRVETQFFGERCLAEMIAIELLQRLSATRQGADATGDDQFQSNLHDALSPPRERRPGRCSESSGKSDVGYRVETAAASVPSLGATAVGSLNRPLLQRAPKRSLRRKRALVTSPRHFRFLSTVISYARARGRTGGSTWARRRIRIGLAPTVK